MVKNTPANAGNIRDQVQPLDWEDPLEKAMAPHSSTLAWKIPRMEEPSRLQSQGVTKSYTSKRLSTRTNHLLPSDRIYLLSFL